MSQITTHVLDTSKGKPAWGVIVALYEKIADEWFEIARGTTNKEGKLTNLLPEDRQLEMGVYRMVFDIKHYFSADDIPTFFPQVEVVFELSTIGQCHIPLLVSPYGYTTYKGC